MVGTEVCPQLWRWLSIEHSQPPEAAFANVDQAAMRRLPVSRSCSLSANRSVMPAM